MSISEQVKGLRTIANNLSIGHNMPISLAIERFREAAATIEALSANLEENGGRWIACEDRLPRKNGFYMVTKKIRETGEYFTGKGRFDIEKSWNDPLNFVDVVAWQPLPEPYHP